MEGRKLEEKNGGGRGYSTSKRFSEELLGEEGMVGRGGKKKKRK